MEPNDNNNSEIFDDVYQDDDELFDEESWFDESDDNDYYDHELDDFNDLNYDRQDYESDLYDII